MIILNEDDEPWEREPLPAEYDDDPIDEPPPLPSESDRAARAWEADRLTRGEP